MTAVDNGIQYLNDLDEYVSATRTLSQWINFIIIPVSVCFSFIVFEFLVPLLFFRRGWQTLGMPASGPRVQTVDYFKSATSITITGGLVTYTTSKGVKTYQIKLCRAADLSLTF